MKSKKISISFSSYYSDVYHYLKNKPNISLFICELVRTQMNAKDITPHELETKVEELIKKVLKQNNYSCDNNFSPPTSQNIINHLNKDDKSLIKDLF